MAWLYMEGLPRVLNMSDYGSICLYMNIPQYALMSLNIPEQS